MMNTKCILPFIVLLCILLSDAFGNTTTETLIQQQNARAFLKIVEQKHAKIDTVWGEFEQRKESKLFLENIYSRGKFYFKKPGKFRCDYLPPNESQNLVISDTWYIYVPEIKQVEIYHFDKTESKIRKLNQMLLGFGVSVEDVEEVYDIHQTKEGEDSSLVRIDFIPKENEEDYSMDAITIKFDRKTLLPTELLISEEGGDRTEIFMKKGKIYLNKKLDDSYFKPRFLEYEDVEIIEQY